MPDPPQPRRQARQLPFWQESILLVLVAVVLAIVVKTFFLQAFYIPSESMEPTMLVDDKILVQKISYWAGSVHRGDVVVFDDPGGWLQPQDSPAPAHGLQRALEKVGLLPAGGHLIKRVIGTGGDHVVCCVDDRLQVNGVTIDEPYTFDTTSTRDTRFDVVVPRGSLWVMGDNRGNSTASPQHRDDADRGFVRVSAVVGKAWVRLWPLGRAGFLHDPSAFAAVPAP